MVDMKRREFLKFVGMFFLTFFITKTINEDNLNVKKDENKLVMKDGEIIIE